MERMHMNNQAELFQYEVTNEPQVATQTPKARRKRRFWSDLEKIEIINKFDVNELSAVEGLENYVFDPKSGEDLSILTIERWRDSYRTSGLLQPKAQQVPTPQVEDIDALPGLKKLLLNTLKENQELQTENIALKKMIAMLSK